MSSPSQSIFDTNVHEDDDDGDDAEALARAATRTPNFAAMGSRIKFTSDLPLLLQDVPPHQQ